MKINKNEKGLFLEKLDLFNFRRGMVFFKKIMTRSGWDPIFKKLWMSYKSLLYLKFFFSGHSLSCHLKKRNLKQINSTFYSEFFRIFRSKTFPKKK